MITARPRITATQELETRLIGRGFFKAHRAYLVTDVTQQQARQVRSGHFRAAS